MYYNIIDANKEVGLEVNADKTKYMLLSRHQNAGHLLRYKNMEGIESRRPLHSLALHYGKLPIN
jgi:hypothetical protein